ncbi:histidinol dehydrogenase [Aliidiomarina taiwanensis]|uniref:Histidinol dehydrogenase n=1 Tax=Aliidiomarina taiwanensis TaxID=946228 RepID=A0A432X227_9GAMM|nr:histidinol dehydrogenase [Aliidiomarina taiwanensis]RUO40582.1 histidinol dehydrogenase [Aliidiomarina taiwanensis]
MSYSIPTSVRWSQLNAKQQQNLLQRPVLTTDTRLQAAVADILATVRCQGDEAVQAYSQAFDGMPSRLLTITADLSAGLNAQVKKAIDTAYANIRRFHQQQQPSNIQVETSPGVQCQLNYTPFESVGLYIPGGSAVLPSTVLMLGVPAQLAGCQQVLLATPPNRHGDVSPAVAYAAQKCGIQQVLLAGGAQAIAAFAYGTESVPAVHKIFGPGNAYVTAAKQQVSQQFGGPAFDMPAGPSELLVVADSSAEPDFIAADLLSQAEHGPDSQVLCVSPSRSLLQAVEKALQQQVTSLPRHDIALQALSQSRLIETDSLAQAYAISQNYAPEHLSVQVAPEREAEALQHLTRAGSIFVGHYTPESGGDYATGTNHVLPTYGFAKNYSSLGLLDFYRRFTVQRISPQGLAELGGTIQCLAQLEGLEAHARAVSLRLQSERFRTDSTLTGVSS